MPSNEAPPLDPSADSGDEKEESNALERLLYFLKQRAVVLGPRPEVLELPPALPQPPVAEVEPRAASDVDVEAEAESFQFPADFRLNLLSSYRERQRSGERSVAFSLDDLQAAAVLAAPSNNWIPRGPSVVRKGQASNRPPVSGRVTGVAVARGGERVYVASANGGVWRSDDGGLSWRSMMEAWDLDPTTASSDSLSCGAIAIDLEDPDRVYVGTGEGDNVFIRGGSILGTGAYFGVGPIRSDDGGQNWYTEPVAPGSETAGGSAFYALAIDPGDRERVVGATIDGLYRREPAGAGNYHWVRKLQGIFTSVVAARADGQTAFFAARWGGAVYYSQDGDAWNPVGKGLPSALAGRVGLAVQPHNPAAVYCLIERRDNHMTLGVWRLDAGGGSWKNVGGHPPNLLGNQGSYDLAIAIDPADVNLIYLGGATVAAGGQWSASLYRCRVTATASGITYAMTPTYIGATVHPDVHTLHFTPGDGNSLWVGCDGGLFFNGSASASADFVQRNVGLATLTMNHMGLHPAEEAVLFAGTQDNGTLRYTGEEVWLHSGAGDGGCVVVNWNDPYSVVRVYVKGAMSRTRDGGQRYNSWNQDVSLPAADRDRAEFYPPLAGAPYNPASPQEAEILAFGGRRPWVSYDFGDNWKSIPDNLPTDELSLNIFSLAFASATRLYVGTDARPAVDANGNPVTVGGDVYMCEETEGRWSRVSIAAAPLLAGPVTCIAIDPADPTGDSIYITLGGNGDYRHVWRYDGSAWEARSGPRAGSPDSLLDVQHNVIVVDPEHTQHLYAGADIGVWRSLDGGATWAPFVNGLPDAAVVDLKIFMPTRVLLASTHGRGVFERTLDTDEALGTELYVRDTQLDIRRVPSAYGGNDPTAFGQQIAPGHSPDIKVDTDAAAGGYQLPAGPINFLEYADALNDRSNDVPAMDSGGGFLQHRVYVQVHNRGIVPADNVRVTLLLAQASNGIPDLPQNYDQNLLAGKPINSPAWKTVGVPQVLQGVQVGLPRVAVFDFPSNMLLPPAGGASSVDYALLALIHCPDDVYTNSQTSVGVLTREERKAALRMITVR